MKHPFAAFVLAAAATSAHAEFWRGERLAQFLADDSAITARGNVGNSEQAYNAGLAAGFIVSIHDTYYGVTVCSPTGLTVRQLVDATRSFMRANPARLGDWAERIVADALAAQYPCAPDKPGKGI